MDGNRFDDLARSLAFRPTRRGVLKSLLGAAGGGILGGLGMGHARAQDEEPTAVPTETVPPEPTAEPTAAPTEVHTAAPEPTIEPTAVPPEDPTAAPTETAVPTEMPAPTAGATEAPAAAADEGNLAAGATFNISLPRTSGTVGTAITAVVSGARASETITLYWLDGDSIRTLAAGVANASGVATIPFRIPPTPGGTHRLRAQGSRVSRYGTINVRVIPNVVLAPRSGPTGTRVGVTLRGFAGEARITVRWFTISGTTSIVVASVTTSELGSASTSFAVPRTENGRSTALGRHGVEGQAAGSNVRVRTSFTVVCPTGQQETGTGGCCRSNGTTCSTDRQCCSGECNASGRCACAPGGVRPVRPRATFCCGEKKLDPTGACCRGLREACTADSQCCGGVCDVGFCRLPARAACASGSDCASGSCSSVTQTCICRSSTKPCSHNADCCSGTCNALTQSCL